MAYEVATMEHASPDGSDPQSRTCQPTEIEMFPLKF